MQCLLTRTNSSVNLILKLIWTATYIQQQSQEGQCNLSKPSPYHQLGRYLGRQAGSRPSTRSAESAPSRWAHRGHNSDSSAPLLPCRHSEERAWLSPLHCSASHSIHSFRYLLNEWKSSSCSLHTCMHLCPCVSNRELIRGKPDNLVSSGWLQFGRCNYHKINQWSWVEWGEGEEMKQSSQIINDSMKENDLLLWRQEIH